MVLFFLCVKGELENVATLSLKSGENLCFSVRNPLSDYEIREKVVMNGNDFVEQEEGAREPPHHFSLRWEGNKKPSTITILTDTEVKTALKKEGKKSKGRHGSDDLTPRDYTLDDSGNFVSLLCIDCRGMEPTAFFPMGNEFTVVSTGGAQFQDDIDLSDSDWAEYDSDHDLPISISNIEFKWVSI